MGIIRADGLPSGFAAGFYGFSRACTCMFVGFSNGFVQVNFTRSGEYSTSPQTIYSVFARVLARFHEIVKGLGRLRGLQFTHV